MLYGYSEMYAAGFSVAVRCIFFKLKEHVTPVSHGVGITGLLPKLHLGGFGSGEASFCFLFTIA